MDNKKWYKRSATLFWLCLSSLPLIVALIQFIGFNLIHTNSLSYSDLENWYARNDFFNIFNRVCFDFSNFTPSILRTSFTEIFQNFDSEIYIALGDFFGWFTWVFFIHIIVDIVIWLPKMFHSWIDRWC